MIEVSNRTKVADVFQGWIDGTSSISELLADDLQWEIVGNSLAAKHYTNKQQFLEEVLRPFGARFSERFRPMVIRSIYEDGDTVIVLWDGAGTTLDGQPYQNTYAWFLTMREGLVVRTVAFFDSIAFNDLWTRMQPAE